MKIFILLAGLLGLLLPEMGFSWYHHGYGYGWNHPSAYRWHNRGGYYGTHCYTQKVCKHRPHGLQCWHQRVCR